MSPTRAHATKQPGMGLAITGIGLDLTVAALAMAIRATASSTGQWRLEGPVPSVAFGALLAAPGLVALLGLNARRPVMLCAAAVACLPLAVLSIVTLPLWIAALLFLAAWGRAGPTQPAEPGGWRAAIIVGGCVIPLAVAAAFLVLGTKPYTYTYATGGEGGSYVPLAHAAWSLALVALTLAITTLAATSRAATGTRWARP